MLELPTELILSKREGGDTLNCYYASLRKYHVLRASFLKSHFSYDIFKKR